MPRISEGGGSGTGGAGSGEVPEAGIAEETSNETSNETGNAKKSPREAGLVKQVAGTGRLFFL